MLRNLLDEVIRRRLWPIPLVALLVAIAVPLLFLKSATPGAPPATMAAPAVAPAGKLPARAQRLLAGTAVVGVTSRRKRGHRTDPFQAPSSHSASTASSGGGSSAKKDASTAAPASGSGAGATAATPAVTGPQPTPPASPDPSGGNDDAGTSPTARWVDVRFGKRIPAQLHRRIPRLQTFSAKGRIVAIFVKYSPTRNKAVFAIAPGTLIDGTIDCRRKAGLCRYIDIPAGKGVRLTTRGSDGTLVTRRLDVERIVRASRTDATATASSAPANGSCLLGKMLTLGASDMPVAGDVCAS